MRTRSLRFAVPAAALFVVGAPLAAQAALSPPSESSGVAAKAGDLLSVSATNAKAATDTSSASASVISIGGNTVLGLGGTQQGPGENKGSLLDTGPSDVLQLQVAP
jgi:hypothetical protein